MAEETREGLAEEKTEISEPAKDSDAPSLQQQADADLGDSGEIPESEEKKEQVQPEPATDWEKRYKDTQSSYTENQQKLQESQSHLQQLQGAIMNNPRVYDVMAKEFGLQPRPGAGDGKEDVANKIDPESLNVIQQVVDQRIQKSIAPYVNNQQELSAQQKELKDEREIESLKSKGYDVDTYIDAMSALDEKYPGHSAEELYKLAAFQDVQAKAGKLAELEKNSGNSRLVSKPGMSPRTVVEKSSNRGKSLWDMAEEAERGI